MIVPRPRRAADFEALVEGTSRTPADDTSAELLELVGALRELGSPARRPQPRPEFVADLRERLLVAAHEELVVEDAAPADPIVEKLTVRPGRTSRDRRLSAALAGFALVGASASVAVAAQGALPGETLYPVKRALESAETSIAGSDAGRGSELLENARTRLEEVDALAATGDPDVTAVEETLDDFGAQATEASDLLLADYQATGETAHAQELRDFAAESIDALGDLDRRLPDDAHDAVVDAAEVVFAIDAAVSQLCPACVGGVTEVPTQLLASTAPVEDGTKVGEAVRGTVIPAKPKPARPEPGTEPSLPAAPQDPASVTDVQPGVPALDATAPDGDSPEAEPAAPGGSGDTRSGLEKSTKPVTEGVEETAKGAVKGVQETAKGAVKGVQETAKGAVEGTTKSVEETAEDVTDTVEDVLGGLTGAAGQ